MYSLGVITNMYPTPEHPVSGTFVEASCRALRDRGVQVTVCSKPNPSPVAYPAWYRECYAFLKDHRDTFDLVESAWSPHAAIIPAMYKGSLPFTLRFHGFTDAGYYKISPIHRQVERYVLDRVDAALAVSNRVKQTLISAGYPEDRIFVVPPCGIDTNQFKPLATDVRDTLNISASDTVFLYAGRIVQAKGMDTLLRIVDWCHTHAPGVTFILVGVGSPAYLEQFRRYPNCRVAGPVSYDQMPYWFNAADFLLHPTLSEGFGMTVVESMACGTPAIASFTGGIRDHLTSENGIPVRDFTSPDAFLQTVRFAISMTPSHRDYITENAIQAVHDCYTFDRVAAMTMEIHQQVIDRD
jgi:glycosyltransferase involved in cell wall biosynthesis